MKMSARNILKKKKVLEVEAVALEEKETDCPCSLLTFGNR